MMNLELLRHQVCAVVGVPGSQIDEMRPWLADLQIELLGRSVAGRRNTECDCWQRR
jgi:hypothetical protein